MDRLPYNPHVTRFQAGGGKAHPIRFGPFLLERRIAVGGSAEVFLARPKEGDLPAPRLVVKRLLLSARQSADFDVLEREARLHQAVSHANVVRVYGAGLVNREPYIAMEYVDGVDVYRLLRRCEAERRDIPPGLAVHIARRVADALGSVHEAKDQDGEALNIVHRDITPSNIYLSAAGEVKVGDFGIARASQPEHPERRRPSGGLKGKFGYLAPEQVAGEPFDHRADLFSLTVVLGEMLIGERIFPGSGQLAVLLAIRDVNIQPLRRAVGRLPGGLFEVCEKGLARSPDERYQSARAFSDALAPFDLPAHRGSAMLGEWVVWARDSSRLVRRLEGRIRDSVQRLRAVRLAATTASAQVPVRRVPPPQKPEKPIADVMPKVRRVGKPDVETVAFPILLEMLATGELSRDDEVALLDDEFQRIGEIDELARHLLPSTTATTSTLFEPGVPDYRAKLDDTSMMEILARMRRGGESGAVFVERRDAKGPRRKEIYLDRGRLLHVASSERNELLGEYLVRRGALTREHLDAALGILALEGGRLGDTLISMGAVGAMDVFRAIRDQGRDRVAALCGWRHGSVIFYRGNRPNHVEFPLDLDLASPMMAGAIVASRGNPSALLPTDDSLLEPGPRAYSALDAAERGTAPRSLQMVPDLVRGPDRISVRQALAALSRPQQSRGVRAISQKEAAAALVAARVLGWVTYPDPPLVGCVTV